MIYLPVDIRVGSVGLCRIESIKLKFYDKVVKSVYPTKDFSRAVDMDSATLISHQQYTYHPSVICSFLEEKVNRFQTTSLDLLLIDFTSNSLVYIREPLLSALAETLAKLVSCKKCKDFLVLLPEFPGVKCSSSQLFESISEIDKNATIILLSNSGECLGYPSTLHFPKYIKEGYLSAFTELYGSAEAQLEKKCIRRLGHFKSTHVSRNNNVCRIYSYLLHDCDDALKSLFSEWWLKHGRDCKAIVYDLKNNVPFRNIIEAFGDENKIIVGRVEDVLNNERLRDSLRKINECVLVLDVVEKGTVLKKHIEQLTQAGINISSNVATAINKHGDKNSTVGDLILPAVCAFISSETVLRASEYRPSDDCFTF
jgi:hypothetical protein